MIQTLANIKDFFNKDNYKTILLNMILLKESTI